MIITKNYSFFGYFSLITFITSDLTYNFILNIFLYLLKQYFKLFIYYFISL